MWIWERRCLRLRYMRNHCKQLSSETLELTQGEETEEGRKTSVEICDEDNCARGRGAVGNREIIEFLSQKLETRDFLESSLLNNKAARPLQQGCRSGRGGPGAGVCALAASDCVPSARVGARAPVPRSAQLRPFSSSRRRRRPCCGFEPVVARGQHPVLLSIFVLFLFFTSAEVPADSLFVHPDRVQVRPPFFSASQGSGRNSARSRSPLPSPCQGDRSPAAPVRSPLQCASPLPPLSLLLLSRVSFTL